ncbi:MAG TPA: ATP-dependent Clp protease ATP-binding subunit, partial [Candidatus Acetothermia bacterium]|nr:ATP-dependent Clp protease ATP-binding subunit [Candidatus Acetothermia bacterium]
TSNVGSKLITDRTALGFGSEDVESEDTYKDMKSRVMGEVRKLFSPEFLNRLDDIIVFHSLTKEQVGQIAELLLGRLRKRLAEEHDIELKLAESARELLIERGYDPKYGARPMRRTIERLIEDPISERILTKEFPPGCTIVVEAEKGEMRFRTA